MKAFIPFAIFSIFCHVGIFAQQDQQLQRLENNPPSDRLIVYSIFDVDHPEEIKKMDALAQKYNHEKIQFVAITDKVNREAKNLIEKNSDYYFHLSNNANHQVFNSYQKGIMKVFPIHVVVDLNGDIVYKKKGRSKAIDQKLEKRIEKLLKRYPQNIDDIAVASE
ncbi:TlpA family protein disulfide reductase [Namhaeicola litoreus]|uniref:TlpA family protein disulfide reductase n=1 Tax=Namhaeicola litoreus TaxID=1052145 RepID=A0ABW3XZU2_9FLAO